MTYTKKTTAILSLVALLFTFWMLNTTFAEEETSENKETEMETMDEMEMHMDEDHKEEDMEYVIKNVKVMFFNPDQPEDEFSEYHMEVENAENGKAIGIEENDEFDPEDLSEINWKIYQGRDLYAFRAEEENIKFSINWEEFLAPYQDHTFEDGLKVKFIYRQDVMKDIKKVKETCDWECKKRARIEELMRDRIKNICEDETKQEQCGVLKGRFEKMLEKKEEVKDKIKEELEHCKEEENCEERKQKIKKDIKEKRMEVKDKFCEEHKLLCEKREERLKILKQRQEEWKNKRQEQQENDGSTI